MRSLRSSLSALPVFALFLAVGCGTGDPIATTPPIEQPPPVGPPEGVPERLRPEFMKAVAAYEQAKASDGGLSVAECKAVSAQLHGLYDKYGDQMIAAEFNVAALAEECGDAPAAEKIYAALAKKGYALAHNNLGVLHWHRGDHEIALGHFEKAIELDKLGAFAARNNVAAAKRDRYAEGEVLSDFEEAERQIQNVLAVDSSNKAAYENLARLYYDRGRLADKSYLLLANLVTTQAVSVLEADGQESADIHNLRGLLLMEEGNQVDALRAFKRAARVEPAHPDANLNIAFISIRFRDYAAAESALKVALEDPQVASNVEAVIAMGVAKRGVKKYAEAEAWYGKAAKVDPDDPRPWFNLAVLYQEHLTTQANVDTKAIGKLYEQADAHYDKFLGIAEPVLARASRKDKQAWATLVQDAKDRRLIIEDYFITIEQMEKLEAQAREIQRQAEVERQAEMERLRELERQAKQGTDGH